MELAAEPVRVRSAGRDGHEDTPATALVHGVETVPATVARQADAAVLGPREAVARVRDVRPSTHVPAVLARTARPCASRSAAEVCIAAAKPGH